MEYGILKINTTQNNSNGINNEITVLNLIFFNSTVVLISRCAYEGSFAEAARTPWLWGHMGTRATRFISFIIPNRLDIPLHLLFGLSLTRIIKRLAQLRRKQTRLAIAHPRAMKLHVPEPEYGRDGFP